MILQVAVQAFQYARRRLNGSISKATFVRWALKKFGRLGLPSSTQDQPQDAVSPEEQMHGYDFTALMRRLNVDVTNSNQVLPKVQYRQEIARTPKNASLSRSSKLQGRGSSARPACGVSARSSSLELVAATRGTEPSSSTAITVSEGAAPLSGPFKQNQVRPVSAPASAAQRSKIPSSSMRGAIDMHSGEDETSGRLERYLLSKRREELAVSEEEGKEVSPLRSGSGGRSSRERAVRQAKVGARPTTPMMKATYEARPELPTNGVNGLPPTDNFEALLESEFTSTEASRNSSHIHQQVAHEESPQKSGAMIEINHNPATAVEQIALSTEVEEAIEQPRTEQMPYEKSIDQALANDHVKKTEMIETTHVEKSTESTCPSPARNLPCWSASSPGGALSGHRINASAPLTPSSGGKSLDFLIAQAAEQEATEMNISRNMASVPLKEEVDEDGGDDANSVDLRAAILDAESLAAAAEAQAQAAREEVARLRMAITRSKTKPENGEAFLEGNDTHSPTTDVQSALSATEDPANRVSETQTSMLTNDEVAKMRDEECCEAQQHHDPATIGIYSAEVVASVFHDHDWNNSGDLDIFELASAVAELWGKPPSTAQVSAMVRASGAMATNSLTFVQFTDLLAKDWPEDDGETSRVVDGCDAQAVDVYHCVFHGNSLGFGVSFDRANNRIVVSDVSSALSTQIYKGDGILAVNSAPLGKVDHPAALQQALKPLRRPVTISFVRSERQVIQQHLASKDETKESNVAKEIELTTAAMQDANTEEVKVSPEEIPATTLAAQEVNAEGTVGNTEEAPVEIDSEAEPTLTTTEEVPPTTPAAQEANAEGVVRSMQEAPVDIASEAEPTSTTEGVLATTSAAQEANAEGAVGNTEEAPDDIASEAEPTPPTTTEEVLATTPAAQEANAEGAVRNTEEAPVDIASEAEPTSTMTTEEVLATTPAAQEANAEGAVESTEAAPVDNDSEAEPTSLTEEVLATTPEAQEVNADGAMGSTEEAPVDIVSEAEPSSSSTSEEALATTPAAQEVNAEDAVESTEAAPDDIASEAEPTSTTTTEEVLATTSAAQEVNAEGAVGSTEEAPVDIVSEAEPTSMTEEVFATTPAAQEVNADGAVGSTEEAPVDIVSEAEPTPTTSTEEVLATTPAAQEANAEGAVGSSEEAPVDTASEAEPTSTTERVLATTPAAQEVNAEGAVESTEEAPVDIASEAEPTSTTTTEEVLATTPAAQEANAEGAVESTEEAPVDIDSEAEPTSTTEDVLATTPAAQEANAEGTIESTEEAPVDIASDAESASSSTRTGNAHATTPAALAVNAEGAVGSTEEAPVEIDSEAEPTSTTEGVLATTPAAQEVNAEGAVESTKEAPVHIASEAVPTPTTSTEEVLATTPAAQEANAEGAVESSEEAPVDIVSEAEPTSSTTTEETLATTPAAQEVNAEGAVESTEEAPVDIDSESEPTSTTEEALATTPAAQEANAEGAVGSTEEAPVDTASEAEPTSTTKEALATTPAAQEANAEGAVGSTEEAPVDIVSEAEPASSSTSEEVPATTSAAQEVNAEGAVGSVDEAPEVIESSTELEPLATSTVYTAMLPKESCQVSPAEAIDVDAPVSERIDQATAETLRDAHVSKVPEEPLKPAQDDAPLPNLETEAADDVFSLLAASEDAITAAEASLPAAHQEYVNSTAFTEEVTWRMRNLAQAGNSTAPLPPPVCFEACVPLVRGLVGDSPESGSVDEEALNARLVSFVQAFDVNNSGMLEMLEFALFLRWFYAVAFAEENSDYAAGSLQSLHDGDTASNP